MNKIAFAKLATNPVAQGVGKAIGLGARGARGAFDLAGDVGEGIAKGVGSSHHAVGRAAVQAAAVGGAGYGGVKAKRRADRRIAEWKYNHGFYGV